jgi:hypothetical protein
VQILQIFANVIATSSEENVNNILAAVAAKVGL